LADRTNLPSGCARIVATFETGAIAAKTMLRARRHQRVTGRPFDTALTAAHMIYSGVFDKHPKLKVFFVHMDGALAPVVCRVNWNWELNYKGIQNPPIHKVDKNLRKPSEYFKTNIYVDTSGPSAIGLKTMIEMCGSDRVLFGTDFGPVPTNPKVHIDLVMDTITDAGDRNKIFSTNTLALFRLSARTQLDRRGVAASD
jgi:predicted TIM-barrel fold metal-dependent hydrolase